MRRKLDKERPRRFVRPVASGVSPEVTAPALRTFLLDGTSLPVLAESSIHEFVGWADDDALVRAQRLERALVETVARLGTGDWHASGSALLGLSPGAHGLPLKRRRKAAADALDLSVSTFRRDYEDDLL